MRRLTAGSLVLFAAAAVIGQAQSPQFTNAVRAFIKHDPQKLIQAVTGRVGLW